MNIAIVGANGQVGTELCFILKERGHYVRPIIRNKLAQSFLKHHGFDCHIQDITDEEDAIKAFKGIDIIIISTYVIDVAGPSHRSRKINNKIIYNCLKYSSTHTAIIYFSSIRALSWKVDPITSRFKPRPPYDKDKKSGERVLLKNCSRYKKKGFALRLGHVVGLNQAKTKKFRNQLVGKKHVYFQVDPDKPSNVLHCVTLADGIIKLIKFNLPSGIFSIVNSPQWTWKELFDYYNSFNTNIYYTQVIQNKQTKSFNRGMIIFLSTLFRLRKNTFMSFRAHFPEKLDSYLINKKNVEAFNNIINEFESNSRVIVLSEFSYKPIPRPFIPSLSNTKELINRWELESNPFLLEA